MIQLHVKKIDPGHGRDIPTGPKIRAKMVRIFRAQRNEVVQRLRGRAPRSDAPYLDHWTQPMADALLPEVLPIFYRGGEQAAKEIAAAVLRGNPRTRGMGVRWARNGWRLKDVQLPGGISIGFDVFDPRVYTAAKKLTLDFCDATNATTTQRLQDALNELRASLGRGLEQGEAMGDLAVRVGKIFNTERASMIAQSEASRATHAGQQEAAVDSGVVEGKTWLASADACPSCLSVDGRTVKLDEDFYVHPTGKPGYRRVPYPPFHPSCMCAMKMEIGGPATIERPVEVIQQPAAVVPMPAPKPTPFQVRTVPHTPESIKEAIAKYTRGDEVVKKIADREKRIETKQKQINAICDQIAETYPIADKISDDFAAGKITPKEADNALKEYDAKVQELLDKRTALREKRDKEITTRTDHAHKLLKPKDAAQVNATLASPYVSMPAREAAREAEEFYGKVLHKDATSGKSLNVPVLPLPGKKKRAFHLAGNIYLGDVEAKKTATAIHEMGHALEYSDPQIHAAAMAFLKHRCGNEVPISLQRKFPGYGFSAHERGRKDEFDKVFDVSSAYYVGKHYDHPSTEVISMGIEKLFGNPVSFATKDPEYFKFILGILDGTWLKAP